MPVTRLASFRSHVKDLEIFNCLLSFNAFTGPPKALDEDETEFLDALETVSMANCGGDMGMANLSWGFLGCDEPCLASLYIYM